MTPERNLWLNVVIRAQEEAAEKPSKPSKVNPNPKVVKYLAYRWLRAWTPDLAEICELAGFTDRDVTKLIELERSKWRKTQ